METLDEFVRFAQNSHIVVADYETNLIRLEAMVALQAEEDTPILRKWIAEAHRRLEVLRAMYTYAKAAQQIPIDELTSIYAQLKTLRDGG